MNERDFWTEIVEGSGIVTGFDAYWSEAESNYLVISGRSGSELVSFDPDDTSPHDHRSAAFLLIDSLEANRQASFDRYVTGRQVVWEAYDAAGKVIATSPVIVDVVDEPGCGLMRSSGCPEHMALLGCLADVLDELNARCQRDGSIG